MTDLMDDNVTEVTENRERSFIECNGNRYELKYSENRLEQIEAVVGDSAMALLSRTQGMLKINDLKVFTAYGLKNLDGGYLSLQHGMKIAEQEIRKGYAALASKVFLQVQTDVPFLFQ